MGTRSEVRLAQANGRSPGSVGATEEYKSRNRSAGRVCAGRVSAKARLKSWNASLPSCLAYERRRGHPSVRRGKKDGEAGTIMRENGERDVKLCPLSNKNARLSSLSLSSTSLWNAVRSSSSSFSLSFFLSGSSSSFLSTVPLIFLQSTFPNSIKIAWSFEVCFSAHSFEIIVILNSIFFRLILSF